MINCMSKHYNYLNNERKIRTNICWHLCVGSAGENAFICRRMPFNAGHENWIEQHSKRDSYYYVIQLFY